VSTKRLAEAEAQLTALGPTPFPLPLGPYASIVEGGFTGMKKSDWVVGGMRERLGAVLRGCTPERLVDGHAGAKPYKVAPASDAPGTRALHAVGLSLASGDPVLCFLGLASAASGDFHEALNAASLTGAKVIFLVTVSALRDAPVGPQLATSPSRIAEAFDIPVVEIASDVKSVKSAVAKARKAGQTTLIQASLE